MAVITNKSANGTSFWGVTIDSTVNELTQAIGHPPHKHGSDDGKVNYEWVLETSAGDVFTIYDWKEYRYLSKDRIIEWHIGSHDKLSSIRAAEEIRQLIK